MPRRIQLGRIEYTIYRRDVGEDGSHAVAEFPVGEATDVGAALAGLSGALDCLFSTELASLFVVQTNGA